MRGEESGRRAPTLPPPPDPVSFLVGARPPRTLVKHTPKPGMGASGRPMRVGGGFRADTCGRWEATPPFFLGEFFFALPFSSLLFFSAVSPFSPPRAPALPTSPCATCGPGWRSLVALVSRCVCLFARAGSPLGGQGGSRRRQREKKKLCLFFEADGREPRGAQRSLFLIISCRKKTHFCGAAGGGAPYTTSRTARSRLSTTARTARSRLSTSLSSTRRPDNPAWAHA
jgi:hypothetical protein